MRLVINDALSSLIRVAGRAASEFAGHLESVTAQLGVLLMVEIDGGESQVRVEVPPQNISLGERDANLLFCEVLQHLDVDVAYAGLGGEGADFSLMIAPRGGFSPDSGDALGRC